MLKYIKMLKFKKRTRESEEIKTDPIIDSVISKIKSRSEVGIKKYGTTLDENNTDDFLTHLQEELMDAINYIEKLKSIKK